MTSGAAEHLHTLSRMWGNPRRTRREIEAFRDRKLRLLVRHAWANVPFYREKLEAAGVRPEDVTTAADLARLPTTTKTERRMRDARDLLARGVDAARLTSQYTTGSTGEPVRVRRALFEDLVLNQFRLRARIALGVHVRDRTAYVVSPGVPTDHKSARDRVRRAGAAFGIHRGILVDCLRTPEEIARDLVRLRPEVIGGYASSLVETIEPWLRLGGARHPPRRVLCGGESMTPAMRDRLRAGFGVPVYELYGCRELHLVAWECVETGDLHLCEDGGVIEVLYHGRPAAPGESGDVVVTNLHAYSSPYLRYELGDCAVAGETPCRCGAPFATIRRVQGRSMDVLVLPGGRVMHHWELIPMAFWDMPWHRQYQVVQESPQRVVLRLVADRDPPAADLEHLRRAVLEKLGAGASFDIERIDEVERGRSGKWRACVSHVDRSALRDPRQ